MEFSWKKYDLENSIKNISVDNRKNLQALCKLLYKKIQHKNCTLKK